jgi:hypothetical protein
MTSKIKLIAGSTLSYSGIVAMPLGTWTAVGIAINRKTGAVISIPVDTALIGPTAGNAQRRDWTINMRSTAAQTTGWASGGQTVEYAVVLKFTDTSPVPVVLYSNPFCIEVRSWPS